MRFDEMALLVAHIALPALCDEETRTVFLRMMRARDFLLLARARWVLDDVRLVVL